MRKLSPLGELRAFEAAARLSSFKAAANELGVTPTAISHQIRQLEARCGVTLFRRRPRPLSLTSRGAQLYPRLRDGFDSFAQAIREIAGDSERLTLRVTTTNAFAHRWLVPRLSQWREAHPEIALDIVGTDAVVDLTAGEADIAIRYYPNSRATTRPGEELCRDTFWPICAPNVLHAAPIRAPEDLRRHTLINSAWDHTWEPYAPTWRRWLEAARVNGPEMLQIMGSSMLNFQEELHAIEAVIAGQGIAILSDILVASELKNGILVKAFDLSLPGFGFYIISLHNHPSRRAIDTFRAWLRSAACQIPIRSISERL